MVRFPTGPPHCLFVLTSFRYNRPCRCHRCDRTWSALQQYVPFAVHATVLIAAVACSAEWSAFIFALLQYTLVQHPSVRIPNSVTQVFASICLLWPAMSSSCVLHQFHLHTLGVRLFDITGLLRCRMSACLSAFCLAMLSVLLVSLWCSTLAAWVPVSTSTANNARNTDNSTWSHASPRRHRDKLRLLFTAGTIFCAFLIAFLTSLFMVCRQALFSLRVD